MSYDLKTTFLPVVTGGRRWLRVYDVLHTSQRLFLFAIKVSSIYGKVMMKNHYTKLGFAKVIQDNFIVNYGHLHY